MLSYAILRYCHIIIISRKNLLKNFKLTLAFSRKSVHTISTTVSQLTHDAVAGQTEIIVFMILRPAGEQVKGGL